MTSSDIASPVRKPRVMVLGSLSVESETITHGMMPHTVTVGLPISTSVI